MISHPKRWNGQVAVGVLSVVVAAALFALLGWLAVEFTIRLTDILAVVATIIGWILWPFWI